MAASAWTVYVQAKHKLGLGTIDLSGASFKAVLFRSSATAGAMSNDVSTLASIGTFTSTAGGGDEVHALGSITWTGNASAGSQTRVWDAADLIFTASTQAISNVRFCVIYRSNGASAGTGIPICYASLSTAAFPVASSNTLTVQLAATGIFTLL